MNWWINRAVTAAFGLALAILALVGWSSYRAASGFSEAAQWRKHTQDVLATIRGLLIDLDDMETGSRGYVITGQESFLEPYTRGLAQWEKKVHNLGQLTWDNPHQQRRIETLEPLIQRRISNLTMQVAIRRARGLSAATGFVSTGTGKELMDDIRQVLSDMENEEYEILGIHDADVQEGSRNNKIVSVLGSLLSLLLVTWAGFAVSRDISARTQAERAANDARTYAEQIIATIREPLLVLTRDLRVRTANRSFYLAFSTSSEETEGRFLYELGGGQWNNTDLRQALEGVLNNNARLEDVEIQNEFPSIGRRTMLLNARKLYREGNHTELVLLAIEDITDRKQAEEDRNRHQERIESQNRELERATQMKSQFLSTMSHELRTPLNAVLGFSDMLRDERHGTLNDRQRRYVNHVNSSGKHLLRLINDILDLSKIEAGKMELIIENVSVHTTFDDTVETLRLLAENKSQTLAHHAEPDLLVRADPVRLKQVLVNLAGNAIKFTPEGGRVELKARQENGQVRLEVWDNGPGIPVEEQQHVFDAFSRLRQSAQVEGTGLGLAITKRLVELHGGNMGLESQPGQGSCFHFMLPATEAVQKEPEQLTPPVEGLPQDSRILVIEDDPAAAQIISSYLASSGYEAVICDQPQHAVERVAQLQPHAVTLDLLMKPTNGWEILFQLKLDPRTRQIPVVVVTILNSPGNGAAFAAEEYLVKPVDKPTLLAAINRCLARRGIVVLKQPVLVMEDDEAVRAVLTELLTSEGFSVVTAADGLAARNCVRSALPALVILDLTLPEVSGFELLAEWRASPRTTDLPIFVLTGRDLSLEEQKYLLAHSESLFQKKSEWQENLKNQLHRVLVPNRAVGVAR